MTSAWTPDCRRTLTAFKTTGPHVCRICSGVGSVSSKYSSRRETSSGAMRSDNVSLRDSMKAELGFKNTVPRPSGQRLHYRIKKRDWIAPSSATFLYSKQEVSYYTVHWCCINLGMPMDQMKMIGLSRPWLQPNGYRNRPQTRGLSWRTTTNDP